MDETAGPSGIQQPQEPRQSVRKPARVQDDNEEDEEDEEDKEDDEEMNLNDQDNHKSGTGQAQKLCR
jgi:hypothetical protein